MNLFVPGRLCLIGEHADWAGGYRKSDPSVMTGLCMITGTDQGLFAEAGTADGEFLLRQVRPGSEAGGFISYPADPAALRGVAEGAVFDSYAAGTASLVLERFPGLGLRLDVYGRTLPLRKGLSSSAAVCVLTARAFNSVHGLGMSVEEEMDIAYRGELMTGSECGRMDQACVFGSVPVLLTFDGDLMSVRVLGPSRDLHLLVADLGRSKDTRRILHELNLAFSRGEEAVRDALGASNHRIMEAACRAVEEGDTEALGSLMTEAQEVFDRQVAPFCPGELDAPVLHSVLGHPAVAELSLGGKGVGSQGDGSAQLLCRDEVSRRALREVLERDLGLSCLDLTIPGRV